MISATSLQPCHSSELTNWPRCPGGTHCTGPVLGILIAMLCGLSMTDSSGRAADKHLIKPPGKVATVSAQCQVIARNELKWRPGSLDWLYYARVTRLTVLWADGNFSICYIFTVAQLPHANLWAPKYSLPVMSYRWSTETVVKYFCSMMMMMK